MHVHQSFLHKHVHMHIVQFFPVRLSPFWYGNSCTRSSSPDVHDHDFGSFSLPTLTQSSLLLHFQGNKCVFKVTLKRHSCEFPCYVVMVCVNQSTRSLILAILNSRTFFKIQVVAGADLVWDRNVLQAILPYFLQLYFIPLTFPLNSMLTSPLNGMLCFLAIHVQTKFNNFFISLRFCILTF